MFSGDVGVIWDEDVKHTIVARLDTADIPVLYRLGGDGDWRVDKSANYPVLKGAARAYWNEWTGSTWQRTEASTTNFVLAHIWAFPGLNYDAGQFVAMMGQAEYLTQNAARLGAQTEFLTLSTGTLPTQEFVPVGTFIFQTATTYSNDVSARIVQTDTGEDFVDFR
jgi:hypothetical protein